MSATTSPFNKAESNPQAIQRLLDENAQLIKALVENMANKGKSMECIQYQQTLHKNLVFLAGLADPNLNIQALLPSPSNNPPAPHSTAPSTGGLPTAFPTSSSSSNAPIAPVSTGVTQPLPRQPQATMNPASTSPDTNWSANSQAARATPPSTMSAGQFPPGGSMRSFDGSMWSSQGQQPGMYGMQPSGGFGSMMSPEDRQRQQQMLRIRQEHLIQAQQMRRMQMQQGGGPGTVPGGGGMYPSMGPSPGMMPPGGMPPSYPPTSMMMPMPPGPMNMH